MEVSEDPCLVLGWTEALLTSQTEREERKRRNIRTTTKDAQAAVKEAILDLNI